MQLFIVTVLVLAFSAVDAGTRQDDKWPPKEFLEKTKSGRMECRDKTGVSEESIKEFSDGQIHEDANMKCYMNCLFHYFKLVDDAGEVHFDTIQFHVDKLDEEIRAIVDPLVKACQNPAGADQCERAFSIHKCWKQMDPHHYFLA